MVYPNIREQTVSSFESWTVWMMDAQRRAFRMRLQQRLLHLVTGWAEFCQLFWTETDVSLESRSLCEVWGLQSVPDTQVTSVIDGGKKGIYSSENRTDLRNVRAFAPNLSSERNHLTYSLMQKSWYLRVFWDKSSESSCILNKGWTSVTLKCRRDVGPELS